jgi:hypothetical protein
MDDYGGPIDDGMIAVRYMHLYITNDCRFFKGQLLNVVTLSVYFEILRPGLGTKQNCYDG